MTRRIDPTSVFSAIVAAGAFASAVVVAVVGGHPQQSPAGTDQAGQVQHMMTFDKYWQQL